MEHAGVKYYDLFIGSCHMSYAVLVFT